MTTPLRDVPWQEDDPALYDFLREIKDRVESTSVGVASLSESIGTQVSGQAGGNPGSVVEDLTPPPGVSNFGISVGIRFIGLTWDVPAASGNVSHTEVWRNTVDNLSSAQYVGASPYAYFIDEVGAGSPEYFYWARHSRQNVYSPVYGDFSSSVSGQTPPNLQEVLDLLEGQLSELQLTQVLNTRIDDTEALAIAVDSTIDDASTQYTVRVNADGHAAGFGLFANASTSAFIVAADIFAVGQSGYADKPIFAIAPVNGTPTIVLNALTLISDAAITNLMVESVAADKLFVLSGTIADAILGNAHITNAMIGNVIQSDNWNATTKAGWRITKDTGLIEAQGVRLYDDNGNLVFSSGTGFTPGGLGDFAYIDILNAANISTYIAAASIDTLLIGDNEVTVPVSAETPNLHIDGSNTHISATSLAIRLTVAAPITVLWSLRQGYRRSSVAWGMQLKHNGASVENVPISLRSVTDHVNGQAHVMGVAGLNTFELFWGGTSARIVLMRAAMTAFATKR